MEVLKSKMEEMETELRLGLPGGRDATTAMNGNGKRGYVEEEEVGAVDLKLKLSSSNDSDHTGDQMKSNNNNIDPPVEKNLLANCGTHDLVKQPPAKAQVVGWPPVRSFRKNIVALQKTRNDEGSVGGALVKVSVDGAPYLRKVDLTIYKSYQDLSDALAKMFSSFTIGNCGSHGMKDFMNVSKLMDLLNSSDYVPTYEDKDGDWMLVGDVPWEMFVVSCKRLRIMKGKEAVGLAPRAMEKCKNRN